MSLQNREPAGPNDGEPPHLQIPPHSPKSARKDISTHPPRVAKRSRAGCLTCRARKVKCDESQPLCQNCKRCNLECKWPAVEDLATAKARRRRMKQGTRSITTSVADGDKHNDTEDGVGSSNCTPNRAAGACVRCLAGQVQCLQERPSCARCRELNLACNYPVVNSVNQTLRISRPGGTNPDHPRQHNGYETDASWSSNITIEQVPKPLLHRLIQAFFTYIYPCQSNGFIHRGTLLRNFQSGNVDRKLLLAIGAVTSRFVEDEPAILHPAQAEAWAKEAKTLLILEAMSTDTVAAALLLARHEVNGGNFSSAWMLSSIATRAALALGLNKACSADDRNLPFTEQETRRRLFWACYCLDRMMSTGLSELVVLRAEHMHLQLPCEEHQYLFGITCWTPVINLEVDLYADGPEQSQAQQDIGMFGQYVQVMQMRYSILKYVRNHPEDPKELRPWDPASTFAKLIHNMSTWKSSLLPQFQLIPDTICVRQSQDQLSPLIMLHLWYEQCMSDLYRIVMPGFPETLPSSALVDAPPGWVQQHQLACARHASNISSIFETVAAVVDMENFLFLDTSLPMVVFESTCVRLQWLFMLPSESLEARIEECKASFKILIRYVERMSRYFRQAQWLLKEMRKMLFRHGIHIRVSTESYNNDSLGASGGSHPWQRRIQRLKDEKAKIEERNIRQTDQVTAVPTNMQSMQVQNEIGQPVDHDSVPLSNPSMDDSSLFSLSQDITLDEILYQDGLAMSSNGWGEAQVIPSLSNFMGMGSAWSANGLADDSGLNRML